MAAQELPPWTAGAGAVPLLVPTSEPLVAATSQIRAAASGREVVSKMNPLATVAGPQVANRSTGGPAEIHIPTDDVGTVNSEVYIPAEWAGPKLRRSGGENTAASLSPDFWLRHHTMPSGLRARWSCMRVCDVPLRLALALLTILSIATVAIAASTVLVTLCGGLLVSSPCTECEYPLLQSPTSPFAFLVLCLTTIFTIELTVWVLGVFGQMLAYAAFRKPASELRSLLGAGIANLFVVRGAAVLIPAAALIGAIVAGTTNTSFIGSFHTLSTAGQPSTGRERFFIFIGGWISWTMFIASALVLWMPVLLLLARGLLALSMWPIAAGGNLFFRFARHCARHGRCMRCKECTTAGRRSLHRYDPNSWPSHCARWGDQFLACATCACLPACCRRPFARCRCCRSAAAQGKLEDSANSAGHDDNINSSRCCRPTTFWTYPCVLPHPGVAPAWHAVMDDAVPSFPRDDSEFPARVLAHKAAEQRVGDHLRVFLMDTPGAAMLLRRCASYSTHYAIIFAAALSASGASRVGVIVCAIIGTVGLLKALAVAAVSCRTRGYYHAALEARVALHVPLSDPGGEGIVQAAGRNSTGNGSGSGSNSSSMLAAFSPINTPAPSPSAASMSDRAERAARAARTARNSAASRATAYAFTAAATVGAAALATTTALFIVLLLGAAPTLGVFFLFAMAIYLGNSCLPHPAGTGCCTTAAKLAFAALVGAAMYLGSAYSPRFKSGPLFTLGGPVVPEPPATAYPACRQQINGLSLMDHCALTAAVYRNDSNFLAETATWFAGTNVSFTPLLMVSPTGNVSLPSTGLRFVVLQQQPTAEDPQPRIHVIIRGSQDAADWVQDFLIWSEALFLKVASYIGPFDTWPIGVKRAIATSTAKLANALNPRRLKGTDGGLNLDASSQSQLYISYIKRAVEGILLTQQQQAAGSASSAASAQAANVSASFTGHSLGGGLATILGQSMGLPAASFSGPGTHITSGPLALPIARPELEYVVVPALDPVPRTDDHVGTIANINCRSEDPGRCHEIVRTCCELLSSCGDPLGRSLSACPDFGYE